MSTTHEKKPSGYRSLSAPALLVGLVLVMTGCFEDRSLGVIGDAGPRGGGDAAGAPAGACAARTDYDGCQALAGCRWLEPGCGTPPLPRPTCAAVAELGCRADGDCPATKTCRAYNVNPCAGPAGPGQTTCGACGQEARICW